MTSIFDVAAYILEQKSPITTRRLHLLCYYSQAWSLVWDETPLFPERFEAWEAGPACPELHERHRGLFRVGRSELTEGDSGMLTDAQRRVMDAVLDFYGGMDAYRINALVRHERPWVDAHGGEISLAAMAEYYGSLTD